MKCNLILCLKNAKLSRIWDRPYLSAFLSDKILKGDKFREKSSLTIL